MKNIVLTGFMGTGKTAVSRELAKLTGYVAVDVDAEIEKTAGMAIKDIFAKSGEKHFRDLETEAIKKISKRKNVIISTGGGAVLREDNISALKSGGDIICLTATAETILKRTEGNGDRPLLQVENPLQKIRELLAARKPYYERAGIMINTEGKTPYQVAAEIIKRIGWKKP